MNVKPEINATHATFVLRLFRTVSVFTWLLIENHLKYFAGSQNMQNFIVNEFQPIVQNDALADRGIHFFS